MGHGTLIIHTTIRAALVCYALTVLLLLMGCRGPRWRHLIRGLWTAGCLTFVAHVVAAFQYEHHWSNTAAIRSTAEQTKALIGWAFGEGLYFSYLFMGLWMLDVVWYWGSPRTFEARPRWIQISLHCYLFFIAFNGAVIFESGVTRPAGIVVTLLLFVVLLFARRTPGAGRSIAQN